MPAKAQISRFIWPQLGRSGNHTLAGNDTAQPPDDVIPPGEHLLIQFRHDQGHGFTPIAAIRSGKRARVRTCSIMAVWPYGAASLWELQQGSFLTTIFAKAFITR